MALEADRLAVDPLEADLSEAVDSSEAHRLAADPLVVDRLAVDSSEAHRLAADQ